MNKRCQQIHLIVGSNVPEHSVLRRGNSVANEAGPQAVLVIPEHPVWLVSGMGDGLHLSLTRANTGSVYALLEQVTHRRHPVLFLESISDQPLRLNGLPTPRFAVLKEKDYLQLDLDFAVHITVFNRPEIGAISESLLGKECPVCRVPSDASSTFYVCPCGAAMHCDPDGKENGLQCAQLRARAGCPACQRPIVLEAGYTFLPGEET